MLKKFLNVLYLNLIDHFLLSFFYLVFCGYLLIYALLKQWLICFAEFFQKWSYVIY